MLAWGAEIAAELAALPAEPLGCGALLGDIREALAELASPDAPVLGRDEALRLIPGR